MMNISQYLSKAGNSLVDGASFLSKKVNTTNFSAVIATVFSIAAAYYLYNKDNKKYAELTNHCITKMQGKSTETAKESLDSEIKNLNKEIEKTKGLITQAEDDKTTYEISISASETTRSNEASSEEDKNKATADIKTAQNKIENLELSIASNKSKLENLNNQLENVTFKLSLIDIAYEDLKSDLSDQNQKIKSEDDEAKKAEIQTKIDLLNEEINRRKTSGQTISQIAKKQFGYNGSVYRYDDVDYHTALRYAYKSLTIKKDRDRKDQLDVEINNLKTSIADLKHKIADLESKLPADKLSNARADLETLKKDAANAASDAEKASKEKDLDAKIKEVDALIRLDSELKSNQESLAKAQSDLSSKEEELTDLNKKIKAALADTSYLDSESKIKAALAAAKSSPDAEKANNLELLTTI